MSASASRWRRRTEAFAGVLLLAGWCGCDSGVPGRAPEASSASKNPVATVARNTSASESAWFREVGATSGIVFRHTTGHADRFLMPEINAGGVAIFDADNDGRMDVFCVNGGFADPAKSGAPGHRLYRNRGGWRFDDVTDVAGVGRNDAYGIGVACGDVDGDGWTDLYVLNLRSNRLYRNRGNGTFEDWTDRAGIGIDGWSSSAAFFDMDRDGDLDLFVVRYLPWTMAIEVACSSRGGVPDYCSPLSYRTSSGDRLYRNRGDGTFDDVTSEFGVDKADGFGMGVATGDFDRDGWVDVFVANDATPNQLWMNRGGRGFADEAGPRGCAVNAIGIPRAGMGVVTVDFLSRDELDVFVTHLAGEGNGWFAADRGRFTDRTTLRGPTRGSLPYTGFGLGIRDFDHDGHWDVFVANGRVRLGAKDWLPDDPYAEPNLLLRGTGPGEFEEVVPRGGTVPELVAAGRGLAVGDLDDDGAEDLVIVNRDGPVHVLRNLVGDRGHWIGFEVLDRRGQPARNAFVRVIADGSRHGRQVQPNEGYASSNDPRLVFGLGSSTRADEVHVRQVDGSEETWGPLPADRYHRLVPGTGRASTSPSNPGSAEPR